MSADARRTEEMKTIRDEVWNLTDSPLYAYRKRNRYYPVLGEGNHQAQIMFIGEAPGKTEAETGRPFCGQAGKLLDELLASVSLDRTSVYITNIVKDRPPDNRDPAPEEIRLYSPFLLRQIGTIQPKIIATLGRFSMQFILETYDVAEKRQTISLLHGRLLKAQTSSGDIHIVPLFHPAVALYNANSKQTLFTDFQVLRQLLA